MAGGWAGSPATRSAFLSGKPISPAGPSDCRHPYGKSCRVGAQKTLCLTCQVDGGVGGDRPPTNLLYVTSRGPAGFHENITYDNIAVEKQSAYVWQQADGTPLRTCRGFGTDIQERVPPPCPGGSLASQLRSFPMLPSRTVQDRSSSSRKLIIEFLFFKHARNEFGGQCPYRGVPTAACLRTRFFDMLRSCTERAVRFSTVV